MELNLWLYSKLRISFEYCKYCKECEIAVQTNLWKMSELEKLPHKIMRFASILWRESEIKNRKKALKECLWHFRLIFSESPSWYLPEIGSWIATVEHAKISFNKLKF